MLLTQVYRKCKYCWCRTRLSGSAAEGGAATDGGALMDIVADAIEVGLTTVPLQLVMLDGMIFHGMVRHS